MENFNALIAMTISEILLLITFIAIRSTQKKKTQLKITFLIYISLIFIWTLGSILQILFQNTNIDPFVFEKLAGIGVQFSPVIVFILALIFSNTKIKFTNKYLLLFVIPITTFILTLTNEQHHLVFINYSTQIEEQVFGIYFPVHSFYSYALYALTIITLLNYSFKNSGFFSKQSVLLILGTAIPLTINFLGTAKILQLTTYSTPISFSLMTLFYALAIFKFKLIYSAPIALQRIVDRISDGYLILNDDYKITDFNKTFLDIFSLKDLDLRDQSIFAVGQKKPNFSIDIDVFKNAFSEVKGSTKTITFEQVVPEINKTFTLEISNIFNKSTLIGILVLFKDITQHKKDIKKIQDSQDIMVEQERLASLGQMVGGIAHNLKTPIFSVSGGLEGLNDLINEFDQSIGNPVVTDDDMHDIAKDMRTWIKKLKDHMSYMSDVITAVKGQTVAMSDNASIEFSITELFKRVDILMKHEIKNALAILEIQNNVSDTTLLSGNINGLVQIINNMISNAIEAYDKKQIDKKIELTAFQDATNIIIAIKDYGKGISEVAQRKLFKEMVTTKGKNGTGLGMFMSYSNIKAHFNGNITYETELGKGTTFYIILPIK